MKNFKTKVGTIFLGLSICVIACLISTVIGVDYVKNIGNTVTSYGFPLRQLWETKVDSKIRALVISKDAQIVVLDASSIYLLDSMSGEVIWSTELPGTNSLNPGLIVNENVIVVSTKYGTNAYDLTTGTLMWEKRYKRLGSSSKVGPSSAQGKIVAVVGNEFVDVRDLRTGRLLWQIEIPSNATRGRTAFAIIDDKNLYAIFLNQIRGYDLITGKLLWSVDTDVAWSASSILFNDGLLYSENLVKNSGFAAFNVETQEIVWQNDKDLKPFSSSITKFEDKLIVPVAWSSPVVLDAETGEVVWQADEAPTATYLESVVVDDVIYVKNFSHRDLYALDLHSGDVIGYLDLGWSLFILAHQNGGPFLVDDFIIFADNDRIFAYQR